LCNPSDRADISRRCARHEAYVVVFWAAYCAIGIKMCIAATRRHCAKGMFIGIWSRRRPLAISAPATGGGCVVPR
jgi:hypothetical protein